jgi:A/G-specific adenine glycosylase
VPRKDVTWLVLLDTGRVLLERRAAPGLWGGLWAFPEVSGRPAQAHFQRMLGCELRLIERLARLEHAFTHFRLRARPLLYALRKDAPRAEQPGRLWLELGEAQGAAVPAPVKKLLAQIAARRA